MEDEMTIKTTIKIGSLELQYEGDSQFFKNEFMELVSSLQGLGVDKSLLGSRAARREPAGGSSETGTAGLTTRSIAARLNSKTGPDLIYAACARLGVVLAKDNFRRREIIDEIKTATGYFRTTMVKNLSSYLKTLIRDGKLIELSNEVYALAASARAELEQRLA